MTSHHLWTKVEFSGSHFCDDNNYITCRKLARLNSICNNDNKKIPLLHTDK